MGYCQLGGASRRFRSQWLGLRGSHTMAVTAAVDTSVSKIAPHNARALIPARLRMGVTIARQGPTVTVQGRSGRFAACSQPLDLGNSFSLDTPAAAGKDTQRKFAAIRALGATITQPANMGSASKPVRAVIGGPGQVIAGQTCTSSGVNCLDVLAPDDVYSDSGTPNRNWQMPDIHITGDAGLVMVSAPGKLQAWSTDHPALQEPGSRAHSPQAVSQNFAFDTFGGEVSITQEKCGGTAEVTVIRGETTMALPMVGDGSSPDSMIRTSFKLCGDPSVALREITFEFHSPVGVPIGSTGLFANGLKGTVEVGPSDTTITIGMDCYYGDPDTFQGHGEVTISTAGMFQFQGAGKILGVVDASGRLWVAWNPLDTGLEMSLHYGLGDIASLDGTVRAHAWRGQGWQNKYTWLPNNPEEEHLAAQIYAAFTIYEGAVIDMWPLVIPPVDLSRTLEIAFGQFCTNSSCSAYEWGIKAALSICGYSVGVYYGFDHGVSVILGNDGHTLIDQYGGAAAQSAAQSAAALASGAEPTRVQAAPQAVNGEVRLPITVTADTEELLLGLGWQAGSLGIELYRPGVPTKVVSNTVHAVFISDTTRADSSFGTVRSKLMGVQLRQPGSMMAGVWTAVITGVTPEAHYKFVHLANKGAPGQPSDRGAFTAPGSTNVNGTGSYVIRWRVDADAPISTTISLYYTRWYETDPGHYMPDFVDVPIAQHRNYRGGQYTWNTTGLRARDSSGSTLYYSLRAIVDDGVNDFPAGSVSDSGDYCEPCSSLPSEYAFHSNRFPGTSPFSSVGRLWVTDTTPPSTPTGRTAVGVDGAILARWNHNPTTDKDLAAYLVEWGRVSCTLTTCNWNSGEPAHAGRVAPILTPTLRIGGVTAEGLGVGQS